MISMGCKQKNETKNFACESFISCEISEGSLVYGRRQCRLRGKGAASVCVQNGGLLYPNISAAIAAKG